MIPTTNQNRVLDPKLGRQLLQSVEAAATTDIKDFLAQLYSFCNFADPGAVVELGVRQGDSTRALICGCMDFGKRLYSFDIRDCREATLLASQAISFPMPDWWVFQQSASVPAGLKWAGPPVGLLFLDTIHTFPYTLYELRAWQPHCIGTICGHDACNEEPTQNGVMPSVRAFMLENPGRYELEVDRRGLGLFTLRPRRRS